MLSRPLHFLKALIRFARDASKINQHNTKIMEIKHDKENRRFTMDIDGQTAKVDYKMRDGKMHLVYSEVPYNLRSNGVGKELLEKKKKKLTEEGYKAVAICSYIRAFALRSPKWSTIID